MSQRLEYKTQFFRKSITYIVTLRGRYQAYTPIVAGAHRGAILHYINNNAAVPTDPRQLLLVDAACEVDCYAADITRTYPVGGKYAGDWKTIYQIVLDMQKVRLFWSAGVDVRVY